MISKSILNVRQAVYVRSALDIGVIVSLTAAHVLFGAERTNATFAFAIIIFFLAIARVLSAGFEFPTVGIAAAASIGALWVVFGGAGRWDVANAEIAALAAGGGIWLLGACIASQKRDIEFFWTALMWALVGYCTFALIVFFSSPIADVRSRMNATFVSPNTAASLFVLCVLLAGGRLSRQMRRRIRSSAVTLSPMDRILRLALAPLLLFLVAGAGLLMTNSRAGLGLGIAALMCLFLFETVAYEPENERGRQSSKSRRAGPLTAIGLLVLAIAIVVAIGDTSFAQRIDGAAEDMAGRGEVFAILSDLWTDRPIFGHGLGSFNDVKNQAENLDNAAMLHTLGAAHNVVLQWLIQAGAVGTGGMAAILIAIHVPIVRNLISNHARQTHMARIAICATLYLFLHGQLDYALEIPSIMWFYALILGLAWGERFVSDAGRPVEIRE